MDILSTNFEENLSLIYESIESSEFIAIDTEFTGLFNNEEQQFDECDTLEERYQKLKASCDNFFMCQLGISTFTFDSSSNEYIIRSFNIYTLPFSPSRHMSIHPSSMRFLIDNHFDMNKLFKSGINCIRLKDAITTPHCNKKSIYKLGNQSQEIVMQYVQKLLEFVNKPELNVISFKVQSRMIKEMLQGKAGALKHFKNLNYAMVVENNEAFMKVTKINGKQANFVPPFKEKELSTDEETFNELGASLIFAAIIKAKVPIIVHNGLFDIGYLYSHFIDELPKSLDEFKNDVVSIFPVIYDTKTIGKRIELEGLSRLNLDGLHKTCLHHQELKDIVRYSVDGQFLQYTEAEKPHEAAYDSHITGVIFLHLRAFLAKKNQISPWDAVKPYINLICLNKHSFFCLNLNTRSDNNDRSEYTIKFKLINPIDLSAISEIFSRYGDVNIRKIGKNDYTAKYDRTYQITMSEITSNIQSLKSFILE